MMSSLECWEQHLKTRAENTRRVYWDYFNRFLEKEGLTSQEFYTLAEAVVNGKDLRQKRLFTSRISNYLHQIAKEGLSGGTVSIVERAIKSFLYANGLEASLQIRRHDRPPIVHEGTRPIQRGQIRTLLESVGNEMKERNQALIMFMKDSGLRASDVAKLKAEDYDKAVTYTNKFNEPFKVFQPLGTKKTGHLAYVHIGPEAVKSLDKYLKGRKNGPLFHARRGDRGMTAKAIINYFVRMKQYLGEEGYKISAHSFRKFHYSNLEAKMPLNWVNKLQGRKSSVYSRPDGKSITELYIESYDMLRVFTDESKKEAKLESRLKEMELEIKKLRSQSILNSEIQEALSSGDIDKEKAEAMLKIDRFLGEQGYALYGYSKNRNRICPIIDLNSDELINKEAFGKLHLKYQLLHGRTLWEELNVPKDARKYYFYSLRRG